MAKSSAVFGLPIPTDGDIPDMPGAMEKYTERLEKVITGETGKIYMNHGFIPDNSNVLGLSPGIYSVSSAWSGKGIINLPDDRRANNAGVLEVIPFANNIRMLRWSTAALNASTKPYTWVRWQGYNGWGPWNEEAPSQAVVSVAGLTGTITPAQLATALTRDIETLVVQEVSKAAIKAAEGNISAFDARYRVEDDGTHNAIFGVNALRLRKYPEARNNAVFGHGALFNLEKGRYNDFFGLQAGYSLNGVGYSESEGKASRNAGFGSNTQRFNKLGMNNVTMGRNSMQCNVDGVNNTFIGAGSGQGIAHMNIADGTIENQLPLNVWGTAALGTATLRYSLGNQNTAVGSYALSEARVGDGNVAVGAASLSNLGKNDGYNGKTRVDVSKQAGWQNLSYTVGSGVLKFSAPSGHGLQPGYMVQASIAGKETQFWYVASVSGNNVVLTVGMPDFTGAGIMSILEYYTTTPARASSGNIAIGRNAGNFLSDGITPATTVTNAVAIGEGATIAGDNTITLGNTSQTVHVSAPVQVRSDARDKTDIQDLDLGLAFIQRLRPVTYRYDRRTSYKNRQPTGKRAESQRRTGLIAQEVAAAGDFTGVHDSGEFYSLSYEELIPVLIRAVQELAEERGL